MNCASIYLPTSKEGKDLSNDEGQIRLKNCLSGVRRVFQDQGMNINQIHQLLSPAESLLDDLQFWRHQSNGLSLFISPSGLELFSLPIHFETYTYVSDHFYLKPLIHFFQGNGRFYLLRLNQKEVKLLECDRYNIHEVDIERFLSDEVLEAAEEGFEEQHLQSRSQQGRAIYHGHGKSNNDVESEIKKYFREVDKGCLKAIKDINAPLILVSQVQYHPIYAGITKHPNLFSQIINDNQDVESNSDLREKAFQLLQKSFSRNQVRSIKEFLGLNGTNKALTQIEKIIPAAVEGRIDKLFVNDSKEIYGLYDAENRSIIIDETKRIGNASLVNLAVVKSFTQSAEVFVLSDDEMPVKGTAMNAIQRYAY